MSSRSGVASSYVRESVSCNIRLDLSIDTDGTYENIIAGDYVNLLSNDVHIDTASFVNNMFYHLFIPVISRSTQGQCMDLHL